MKFSEWLQEQLDKSGLNSASLAEAIGENQPTIYRILSGETKNPRLHIVKKLEAFFSDDSNIKKQSVLHDKESYEVPLISWVAAGGFAEVTDWLADEEVKITTTYRARKHTFALIVDGQSMQPKFPSGCTIIVEPEEKAVNGSYVVVRQNGDQEATFKQLVIEGGISYLKALNPEWPKRIIEMMPDAVIIGVVKQMVMDV